MKQSILLIDDQPEHLDAMVTELRKNLDASINVLQWSPSKDDRPMDVFEAFIRKNDVRLVVTDYDLTQRGQLGLFGATVVDWCQLNAIPVGDFSRNHISSLAKEPNLFELRIPVQTPQIAAEYICTVFRGFSEIYSAVVVDPVLMTQRSPAAALAYLLQAKHLVSQFAQYGVRYGGAGASLVDVFSETVSKDKEPGAERKARVLAYIMGHLLVNAVLRFPGPLMDQSVLASYLAVARDQLDILGTSLSEAIYIGPFSALGPYYWTHKVDDLLSPYRDSLPDDQDYGSPGEENRVLAEAMVGQKLELDPECERCNGKNGGFQCPYTKRTVCQLSDCSVVSNIWIPPGARLSRFEKEFYEEWAPILGM